MRVTRAAIRAGIVHEDDNTILSPEDAPPATPTAPETPKALVSAVLKDITNQAAGTPVATPAKASKYELTVQKTPKFDPEVHKEVENAKNNGNNPGTPKDDSFVEHIIARTPTKTPLRIEDSVEAMDALEEAIEQISEELPVLVDIAAVSASKDIETMPELTVEKEAPVKTIPTPHKVSPAKASPLKARIEKKAPATSKRPTKSLSTAPGSKSPASVKVAAKAAVVRPSNIQSVNRPAPLIKSSAKPAPSVSAVKPLPKTSLRMKIPPTEKSIARPSEAKTTSSAALRMSSVTTAPDQLPNTMQKRKTSGILSTSKPAFVPAKSSKPPTTSSFTLPGEAVAAKLKAQREERQKREEQEAAGGKKTFKARPAPSTTKKAGTLPRENKASRARLSLLTGIATAAPDTQPTNSLNVPKTRTEPNKPNTGARRTTSAPRPSLIGSSGPTIAKPTSPKLSADQLRERTRKARDEAAEKGRQASREWAEKQKKRNAEKVAQRPDAVEHRETFRPMAETTATA